MGLLTNNFQTARAQRVQQPEVLTDQHPKILGWWSSASLGSERQSCEETKDSRLQAHGSQEEWLFLTEPSELRMILKYSLHQVGATHPCCVRRCKQCLCSNCCRAWYTQELGSDPESWSSSCDYRHCCTSWLLVRSASSAKLLPEVDTTQHMQRITTLDLDSSELAQTRDRISWGQARPLQQWNYSELKFHFAS